MNASRQSLQRLVTLAMLALLPVTQAAMGAKTWSAGAAINDPVISAPASNARYGMSTRITLSCNPPSDPDHWVENCASGDEADPAVAATWSDGGAGGNFPDGAKGASVAYVTPAATGNVTLTVTFDDAGTTRANDNAKSANVTIIIVNAKMIFKVGQAEADAITRAESGTFEVVDGNGAAIDGATYANWGFTGDQDVSVNDATNTSRTWAGRIVESGRASCRVTISGNTCSVNKTVTCNARAGWSITPTCIEDNHADYGMYPGASMILGRNRDKDNHSDDIVWPQGPNYEDGYTTATPSSGPNKGVWYISASTFAIDRETCINMFAKPGAAGFPNPPNVNWHEYNEGKNVDADGLLVGVKGHEARGTTGNAKGHQKFLEDEEAKPDRDVKAAIEDNVAVSEAALKSATGAEIEVIDNAITSAAAVNPSGNWGPNTVWEYDDGPGWHSVAYSN